MMSVASPVSYGNLIPLAPEQAREVKETVNNLLDAMVRVNEAVRLEQEAVRLEQEAVRLEQEAVRRVQNTEKELVYWQARGAKAEQKIASGEQKIASGEQKIASGEKKLQAAVAKEKKVIIERFYGIFNGKKPLPIDEVDSLYSTYLADGSITVEMISEKNRLKLNSMKAITRYLDDHPNVITCNFLAFRGEVYDVKTLSDYVAQSSCKVQKIGIDRKISIEAQASLAEAIKAKNGVLKVQYSDN